MTPALELKHLTMSFGGVTALDGATFTIAPGQIHGLLGQNGSGKSTLVKILTGIYTPDSGSATVWGHDIAFPVRRPQDLGIAVIHQDLGLADDLTVFDNIATSTNFGTSLFGLIPARKEAAIHREIMAELGIRLDLDAPVSALSTAERTFVAVVRAVRTLRDSASAQHILILDEPTTALAAPDALQVTSLMRSLAQAGHAVIFISHRLAEVLDVCDSATVLRDGQVVMHQSTKNMSGAELTENILGRKMSAFYPPKHVSSSTEVALRVTDLAAQRLISASFEAHAGEVLGVTGLTGMGHECLPQILAGDLKPDGGHVTLANDVPLGASTAEIISQQLVVVPGNRGRDGAWLDATARENISLPVLKSFSSKGWLDISREADTCLDLMRELDVRPLEPDKRMGNFSGGNQQKAVIAKWMQVKPRVLILDEPTQGVDAGAKHDILQIVVNAAAEGTCVVILSGDHEQLVQTCTRVIVVANGVIVAELTGDDLTEHRLMQACNSLPA